jgi:hypothetical protein
MSKSWVSRKTVNASEITAPSHQTHGSQQPETDKTHGRRRENKHIHVEMSRGDHHDRYFGLTNKISQLLCVTTKRDFAVDQNV